MIADKKILRNTALNRLVICALLFLLCGENTKNFGTFGHSFVVYSLFCFQHVGELRAEVTDDQLAVLAILHVILLGS